MPPLRTSTCKLLVPFVDGITVTHTAVAAGADGNKVVKSRLATLALWYIMTTLVVKDSDTVRTPRDAASAIEPIPHTGDPDLFSESFGYLLFPIWTFRGEITKLHFSFTGRMLYTGLPGRVSALPQ